MALFDRFKRNKQNNVVLPEEVNEYYQSQQRERAGVAVVLGIVALIVTLLIGAGLFFAGRYVYDRFIDDGDDDATTQNITPSEATNGRPNQPTPSPTPDPAAPQPTPAPTPQPTPAPAPAPQPSTPPAAVPATGDGDTTLPRTGDEGM